MSWYYDDDSVSDYYRWRKQAKEYERMRKRKKLLKEKELKQKAKVLKKLLKAEQLLKIKEENKRKRQERILLKKQELKTNGWKQGYVRQNVLDTKNKARDMELCKEIYLKSKSGMTTREIAMQYNRPYNWVFRYKYTYEAYLKALEDKGGNDEN